MRLLEHFGCQAKVQSAGGDDLQPVVVQSHADGPAEAGVVPVHKSVGQCLAYCLHGQSWRVFPLHLAGDDAAGNGQPVDQESLGPAHQVKGVAVVLAVVQKFAARGALEACHAQLELGKIRSRNIGFAEQGNCGTGEVSVARQQAQAAQNGHRVTCSGLVAAATADGFFDGLRNFGGVQHVDGPALSGLELPSIRGVQRFNQQALVICARHHAGCVEHALVRPTTKRDRYVCRVAHFERDDFQLGFKADALYARGQGRLESLKLLGQFFQRSVCNLLPNQFASRRDAKQQLTTLAVCASAERAAGTVFFGRGFFELHGLRFAPLGKVDDVVQVHRLFAITIFPCAGGNKKWSVIIQDGTHQGNAAVLQPACQ